MSGGLYRRVDCAYWLGELAEALRGDEPDAGDTDAHTVAFYLITGPETNQIGAYRLALPTLCDTLNISSRRASEALAKLSGTGFCTYDERFRMVFVTEFARHEYGETPNLADNRVKALAKALPGLLSTCRKSLIWKAFWNRYGEPWAELLADLERPKQKGSGRAPEGLRDASGTGAGSGSGSGSGSGKGERLPAPLSPWYTGIPEAGMLAELIAAGTADPEGHKSPAQTREEPMRVERAHLLAALYLAENGDAEGDTLAELWVAWRQERKKRHKAAVKPPADDWCSDVLALRELRGNRKAREILKRHHKERWQGLRLDVLEEERRRASGRPRENRYDPDKALRGVKIHGRGP